MLTVKCNSLRKTEHSSLLKDRWNWLCCSTDCLFLVCVMCEDGIKLLSGHDYVSIIFFFIMHDHKKPLKSHVTVYN